MIYDRAAPWKNAAGRKHQVVVEGAANGDLSQALTLFLANKFLANISFPVQWQLQVGGCSASSRTRTTTPLWQIRAAPLSANMAMLATMMAVLQSKHANRIHLC